MHSSLKLYQKQVKQLLLKLFVQDVCVNSVNKYFSVFFCYKNLVMATNRYCVDVAKRGTAGCKECKQKIDKGVVRIAKVLPNPFTESGGEMKQWFHTKCIFTKLSRAKAATKKIDSIEDIEGWDDLADEHKPEIEKYISEFSSLMPKTGQKKTPQKTKKKAESDPEIDESNSFDPDNSAPTKDDTLRQFRKIVAEIEIVPEYKKKTAILAKFFSKGSDGSGFNGNLYIWAKMLLPMVEKRVYNLQTKQLFKLFSDIFGCSKDDMNDHFEEAGDDAGDVALTISIFFQDSEICPPASKSTLYLQEVDKYLQRLSQVSREVDQTSLLTEIAKKCTTNDLKMFIRFIKHDLRMNAGPKPVLEAIHPTAYTAFQASRNLKDIICRSVKQNSGSSSQDDLTVRSSLMTPVIPMLAMACKSYEEVFKRCPNGFFVEIKYDGERVQLHKQGNNFSYFSRSLKPVMPYKIADLKDYIPKAFPHGNNLILDCEILLVDKNGKPLPFGSLGAHKKAEFKDASVCLFVFDCLQFNDENLMNKDLTERRNVLKENMQPIPGHVLISEMKEIKKMPELQAIIKSVFKQGLEGVVVKAKDSIYEPGKRHWLKIKKDYLKDQIVDSADLVVLGAFFGTGKFGGNKSTFLMGCKNVKTGKWCTVTKVHNGLDDDDIEQLQKEPFVKDMIKISKDRTKVPFWLKVHDSMVPDFVVDEPEDSPVWEITGAEFTRTEVHTANGISIRFPRITRKRSDKSWKEATDLDHLENLYEISKDTSDIVGLQIINSQDTSANKSDHDSPKMDEESENSTKKIKKEISTTPQKRTKRNVKNEIDEETPTKKTKRNMKNEIEEETPTKKPKLEVTDVKQCNAKATTDSKRTLPDVFSGVKLHIPSSFKKADVLCKYFIAYNGYLLEELELDDATHVISNENSKDDKFPKGARVVTVDWLWDCIKLQKLLPSRLDGTQSSKS